MTSKKIVSLFGCFMFAMMASCNYSKPAEKPDTNGKDSMVNDTTNSSVDTTQRVGDSTDSVNN